MNKVATDKNSPSYDSDDQKLATRKYWILLASITILFTFLFSYLSYLRFTDFYTSTWDLGINRQILWTTTHGYLLFDTTVFDFYGFRSILQLDSYYLAFPISLIYWVFPGALTLFEIQALAVSATSVPLYLITRRLGLSTYISLIFIIAFLVNFSVISALLFDFHWEAFIPLEFFITFYLLMIRKNKYALISIIIGSLTIQVFPFLAGAAVGYFIVDDFFNKRNKLKIAKFVKAERWMISLFIISLFLYVLTQEVLQVSLIPALLGAAPTAHLSSFHIDQLNYPSLRLSLIYWLLLYASFGFIPFYYPKHLIMNLPWMGYSIFIASGYSSYFGYQYSFIAIPPIVLGMFLSISKINAEANEERKRAILLIPLVITVGLSLFLLDPNYQLAFLSLNQSGKSVVLIVLLVLGLFSIYHWEITKKMSFKTNFNASRARKITKSLIIGIFVAILIMNVALSPLMPSPTNNSPNLSPGGAGPYNGYNFLFATNPAFPDALAIAGTIPSNSTVLASDRLFPFIANSATAFSLLGGSPTNMPFLPFNATNLPDYVFVDYVQMGAIPAFLVSAMKNTSIYGLKYQIVSSYFPGNIYLFELNYTGGTVTLYASQPKNAVNVYSALSSLS